MVYVRMVRCLTETARVQVRVDMAVRDLRKSYEKAIETVAVLKKETRDLELCMSREACLATDDAERLDAFTDFLILESARAKRKCERLEHKCKLQAFEPTGLNDLKTLCKQHEQLAKDLLCYSLGHLRRRNSVHTEHAEK